MKLRARLKAAGIHVHLDGDELVVKAATPLTDDQLGFLRAHKPEIVAELRRGPDMQEGLQRAREAREARRRRVLDKLAADPALTHTYEIDADAHPDYIVMALAIRGLGSFELSVDRERFDPAEMLAFLVNQHGVPIDEPLDDVSGFELGRPPCDDPEAA